MGKLGDSDIKTREVLDWKGPLPVKHFTGFDIAIAQFTHVSNSLKIFLPAYSAATSGFLIYPEH